MCIEKPVEMVLQPSWNAFQGAATAESASENPFVQPPLVGAVDTAASLANVRRCRQWQL